MFDFPNTPSVGDLFQDSSSGAVYRWNGYAWIGGVTGIGLQTIKETRYLVAGSFTFTRDPKSSGFADIHLLGGQGARPAGTWASGQMVVSAPGGTGAIGIKWKYALPPTAPVIVGASSLTTTAGASSFDTVLTAAGGGIGGTSTATAAANQTAAGGAAGVAGSSCDENYPGISALAQIMIAGYAGPSVGAAIVLRGVVRKGQNAGFSASASYPASLGDPGVVVVVEYLNP